MAVSTQDRRGEAQDAQRDRQRARTARGLRSAREAGPGERLPAPPRERRPALAALAVLLVVGGAAVAGLAALRADDRQAVLVAGRDIPVGTLITRDDLVEQQVSAEGVDLVPAAARASVEGRSYAVQEIPAGRILDLQMLNQQDPFGNGDAAVGVPVPPGRVPAQGLQTGDVVQLVRVADGEGDVLVERATVSEVGGGTDDDSVTTTTSPVATVLVDPDDAPAVAAAGAADELALVLLERAG
ncbi:SAF domain-containing protein [Pseudokineococcus marinus]|uniref:SAF domain-containing protein n=1 Tax=Pseudokineococcus marinus TaxID=351215 RepID=A0A849BKU7_9ACTN|nr:SAF domain-containing protein [Pseudokineococcus marinus]NNH23820.1 hypothetical protein [Pseudokineococcus marinus]